MMQQLCPRSLLVAAGSPCSAATCVPPLARPPDDKTRVAFVLKVDPTPQG